MLEIPAITNEEGAIVPGAAIPDNAVKVELSVDQTGYHIYFDIDFPPPPPIAPSIATLFANWMKYTPNSTGQGDEAKPNLKICTGLIAALTGEEGIFGQALIAEVQKSNPDPEWISIYWAYSIASSVIPYRDRFNASALAVGLPFQIDESGRLISA